MNPCIEVRDLHYAYPDGTHALRGINFSIASGERVGVIGANGAGKSTLLLHLNGLLPEHVGKHCSVRVDGLGVEPSQFPEIRRRVGLVFQDANDQLFCPTVQEDVAFGPEQLGLTNQEIRARVAESMQATATTGLEHRPPHHLSVGQKRRVCLAGVLACKPSVLVLDEPTSSLDPRGRRELKALLRSIDLTQIIAAHDLQFVAEVCSRVLVLSNGMIAADGPTHDILSNERLMLEHGLECPQFVQNHAARAQSA